jgi:tryptophan halogenase
VVRVIDTIERVELDDQGAIAAVIGREHGALHADLFIDCTGFRAALIGAALGSRWRDLNDCLFVDRALAVQVPYAQADTPIASYTISTAHEAGWTWDIGLQQRRGIGYVFSSRHTDEARAEQVLRRYAGPLANGLTPRLLKLQVGYRPTQWVKNCVAVGLSAGFLEPLESSGIGLIETAAYLIGFLFPHDGNLAPAARWFNDQMAQRFERIVQFIKMHYCLSQRTDSAFWLDNRRAESIPPGLQERLAMWRCRPPHRLDFVTDVEMYPPSSWQYVLYGMEYETHLHERRATYPLWEQARQEFAAIAQVSGHALADLPDHRALVEQMCARHAHRAAALAE